MSYRGRFAPSPTGALHLGSLFVAVGSWLRARAAGGVWLVRMEDLDPAREVPGAARAILATLSAFGLVSDEAVVYQSQRAGHYAVALQRLRERDLVFACRCSRADLAASAGLHRRACAPPRAGESHAWRLRVPSGEVVFHDELQGEQHEDPAALGDFVVQRLEGHAAYQLAVVVDDAEQRISEVLRGADLIDSTARQILLQRALDLATPSYLHLPLLLDGDGHKLSKQNASLPVDGADPLPALRTVLRLLGIDAARLPRHGTADALLHAAIAAFDVARLPHRRDLPAPLLHPPNAWQ